MPDSKPVIFIDDEKHLRMAGQQTLELAGFQVTSYEAAKPALAQLTADWPGVIVCDIKMPQMDGLSFMEQALAIDRDLPVILITGHGDIPMAVKAMRNGAYDFIEKPFPAERLVEAVRRALEKRALTLENRALRQELESNSGTGPWLLGKSPAMQRLRRLITQLAGVPTDVLIIGETGTGKELVAHYLHEYSNRRHQHFVAVNCGALPENLIESELFGHEAGAFTSAQQRRIGKFEHAHGGTLFLDEIESMPLVLQVRLLRALQERVIERLGSNTVIPLNLRIVAATKVDLKEAIAQGTFREDLYYRLNVVILEIPPLRERREDIPLLFQHFALLASARYERQIPPLSGDWMRALMIHPWPGNVRELRNVAERYVLLGENYGFDPAYLLHGSHTGGWITLPEQVDCFEKSVIEHELMRHRGSIADALETLGIPRKTLYDKMRKYGLDRRNYK